MYKRLKDYFLKLLKLFKMKKLFVIAVFVLGLIACSGGQTEKSSNVDSVLTDSIEVVDSIVIDSVVVG